MPLMMARPTKHPKTGVYQFRRVVPADLRALVGRREEKRSLGTKDPEEAKRRFADVWQKVDAKWASLRSGSTTMSEPQAHAAAAHFYDNWLAMHRSQPSWQLLWHTDLYEGLWTTPGYDPELTLGESVSITDYLYPSMRRICFQQADIMIADEGLTLDGWSRNNLARAIGAALQRASLVLKEEAQGIYRETSHLPGQTPSSVKSAPPPQSAEPFTFAMLLEDWKRERQPRPQTLYETTNMVRKLEAHLGFNNVLELTAEHVVGWRDALRLEGLSARTIKNGKLATLKAMLVVAVQNRRIKTNPAEGVVITVKRELGGAVRGYNDEEAVKVLTAAATQVDPVRRWIPLLCAYSGARLSEICHLRAEDIVTIRTIPTMSFSPDAGPLKNTSSVRTVPLHPAVIEAGFLNFVNGVGAGPLFPQLKIDRFGKRGLNGAKVIGRWVRGLGLSDPKLPTSHGWRHRFRTVARVHGLAVDVVDALLGHTRGNVADRYGEFPPEAMLKELVKMPTICGVRPTDGLAAE